MLLADAEIAKNPLNPNRDIIRDWGFLAASSLP